MSAKKNVKPHPTPWRIKTGTHSRTGAVLGLAIVDANGTAVVENTELLTSLGAVSSDAALRIIDAVNAFDDLTNRERAAILAVLAQAEVQWSKEKSRSKETLLLKRGISGALKKLKKAWLGGES
jgi:hypothetical protein